MNVRESENPNEDSFRDQLEWSAFRYAAEEMSCEESDAFEQRLAEDQQAREALARTVHITNAIVRQPEVVSPPEVTTASIGGKRRASDWKSISAIAGIVAICVIFAFGLRFSNVTPQPGSSSGSVAKVEEPVNARDLVIAAWVDFQEVGELPEKSLIADNETPVDDVSPTIVPEPISPEDDGKFDWVIAAVSPEAMENGSIENDRKEKQ